MRKILGLLFLSFFFSSLFANEKIEDANKAYQNGEYKKAMKIYNKLCEEKDFKACASLAHMYRSGKGTKADLELSNKFYKKACNGGNKESCLQANW